MQDIVCFRENCRCNPRLTHTHVTCIHVLQHVALQLQGITCFRGNYLFNLKLTCTTYVYMHCRLNVCAYIHGNSAGIHMSGNTVGLAVITTHAVQSIITVFVRFVSFPQVLSTLWKSSSALALDTYKPQSTSWVQDLFHLMHTHTHKQPLLHFKHTNIISCSHKTQKEKKPQKHKWNTQTT